MKRRFLSMLLCLTMLIGISPTGVLADGVTDVQSGETQTYAGSSDPQPGGEGTEESPYLITSLSELMWFRDEVNGGRGGICARLMSDIEFDGNADNWTPSGSDDSPYIGTFDGNDHKISNLQIDTGLFGTIGNGGVVKNLQIMQNNGTSPEYSGCGILAVCNNGTIQQCSVEYLQYGQTINVKETGEGFGVLAYKNSGTIRDCYAIVLRSDSKISAPGKNAGGIVFENDGTISHCYFSYNNVESFENLTNATIAKNNNGTIEQCYFYTHGTTTAAASDNTPGVEEFDPVGYADEKEVVWKLNDDGVRDVWRFNIRPSLKPSDARVSSDGGSFDAVTPHTHRVDGAITEFTALGQAISDVTESGYYYISDDFADQRIDGGWTVPNDMIVCLNGHSIENNDGSIAVSNGVCFTVTDCQKTAGRITSASGSNGGGVTVNGGMFVLDNAGISGCAIGIDYKNGTVKLSGNASVIGNDKNIRLAEGQRLTFDALDEQARFGITYDGSVSVGGEVEIADETGVEYLEQLSYDSDELFIGKNANSDAVVLKNPEEHSHCVCGAVHKEISGTDDDGTKTGHTVERHTVFTPWDPYSHRDESGNPTLPETAGSYYITRSADLAGYTWKPDGDVKLCLDGHTIMFGDRRGPNNIDQGVVWLDSEADSLTVTDCGQTGIITMDGKRKGISISNGAEYNLYAGTMKGFARAVSIGNDGDQHTDKGTINIYGGTLTENTYKQGPAVFGNGSEVKVTMYDGKITNNTTSGDKGDYRYGGGVYVAGGGSFTMHNGEISGNGKADENAEADRQHGATSGGGVYVGGNFKMTGGKITGNTVVPQYNMRTSGGTTNYYLQNARGGGVCAVIGAAKISGGEITNNTLTYGFGGGVYLEYNSTAVIENTIISGNTVKPDPEYSPNATALNADGTRYYYGGFGGGIYSKSELTLKNSRVENNSLINPYGNDSTNRYGGGAGVYFAGNNGIVIEDGCVISGNTLRGKNTRTDDPIGTIGGAGICVPLANLTIKDSEITGNMAISDSDAAEGKKLAGGGVLFCSSKNSFNVSGTVNISGNTQDGADSNVYLNFDRFNAGKQTNVTVSGTLNNTSKIGVTAATKPTDDSAVQIAAADSEIPDGVFTSDESGYKTVMSVSGSSVSLSVSNDVAEVIHTDGTKTVYEDLWTALKAAKGGETVKVLKDCALKGVSIALQRNITFDLNGKTVTTESSTGKCYIYIKADVTIKNGSIVGECPQELDEIKALIKIMSITSDKYGKLTLENAEIKSTNKASLAVYVQAGELIMNSGTLDGGLHVTMAGTVELSGGTFKKAEESDFGYIVGIKDGVIFDRKGDGIARFLKSGYAFKDEDSGTLIDLSGSPSSIETGKTITVVKCESHVYNSESGKCKYCGSACAHENVDSTWKCTACGKMAAAYVMNWEETATLGRYFSLEDAFASVAAGERKTILIRADEYTLANDIHVRGAVNFRFSWEDPSNKILFDSGKSFIVENGGLLAVAGNAYAEAVTMNQGGSFGMEAGAAIGHLIFNEGYDTFDKTKLSQGSLGKLTVPAGHSVSDLLMHSTAIERSFKHNSGAWATAAELSATEIEDVSVEKLPFSHPSIVVELDGVKKDSDSKIEQVYSGSNSLKLSVSKKGGSIADYRWRIEYYATDSAAPIVEADSTAESLNQNLSKAGRYKIKCTVSKDGYSKELTCQDVVITKGAAKYQSKPVGINNLVYNGAAQTLVKKGSAVGGSILYSLNGTDWSTEAPKGELAGEYTVYYKVDGDDNHNGIDREELKVTIAQRDIADAVITLEDSAVYNGREQTQGIASVKIGELTLGGSDYQVVSGNKATAVGDTQLLIRGKGNFKGDASKIWSLKKADAPLPRFESIEIVRGVAREYSCSLPELLGALPQGCEYGTISYTNLIFDCHDYQDGNARIENGVLKLPIRANNAGSLGTAGTVTVDVITQNYGKIQLTIEIDAIAKVVPNVTPQTDKTVITYGDKLSSIRLSGTSGDDTSRVSGSLQWKNPNETPSAGEYWAQWEFIPAAEEYRYTVASGKIKITVNKAESSHTAPTAKTLTYNGTEQELVNAGTASGGTMMYSLSGTDWSAAVPKKTNADSHTVYYKVQGDANHNDSAVQSVDVSIAKLPVEISWSGTENLVYDGNVKTVNAAVSNKAGTDVVNLTLGGTYSVTDRGEYSASVIGVDNTNYTIEGSTGITKNFTVAPATPTVNPAKPTTARVRRGRTLAEAAVTYGELLGVDGTSVLDGSFEWVDGTRIISDSGTAQMKFIPTDNNYCDVTFDAAVSAVSGGSSSSASSSAYTVRFDTNGGSSVASRTVAKNSVISKPNAPTKDGFEFGGWYADKSLTDEYDFSAKVTKSFTLYAKWVEKQKEPTDPEDSDKPDEPNTSGEDKWENPFTDVSENSWFYEAVKNAVQGKLFGGTSASTFDPNAPITRGMLVTVLYRAEGEPAINGSIPFEDVSKDSYYSNAVIWAEQNGIVTGTGERTFAPNENITREQLAVMLFRYAKHKGYDVTQGGMQIREFEDHESISGYAAAAVAWAVNTGLIKGKTETEIKPQDGATRAETAAILQRFSGENK